MTTGRHIKHKRANEVNTAIPPIKKAKRTGAENKRAIARTTLPFRIDKAKYKPIT
jgi:hypothetical protein